MTNTDERTFYFNLKELNSLNWQKKILNYITKFRFAIHTVMADTKRRERFRIKGIKIMKANGVMDGRNVEAVAKSFHNYFLGKNTKVCPTCGCSKSSRVGYVPDDLEWEVLDSPESILEFPGSKSLGMGDCDDHFFALACLFLSLGINIEFVFIARDVGTNKQTLIPFWSHITIAPKIDSETSVPFETITEGYDFGALSTWSFIALHDYSGNITRLTMNPDFGEKHHVFFPTVRLPVSKNFLNIKKGRTNYIVMKKSTSKNSNGGNTGGGMKSIKGVGPFERRTRR